LRQSIGITSLSSARDPYSIERPTPPTRPRVQLSEAWRSIWLAGPFGSLVLDCGLTAGNIGPPGQENHGPPEPMGLSKLPVKPATQTNAIEQPYLVQEIIGFQPKN
ncbi:MAG: hypothetical protein WB660_09055, partial [Candidatus Sulfotelmatobacter sp.]